MTIITLKRFSGSSHTVRRIPILICYEWENIDQQPVQDSCLAQQIPGEFSQFFYGTFLPKILRRIIVETVYTGNSFKNPETIARRGLNTRVNRGAFIYLYPLPSL